jgi:erythromycin esterase-like protein
MDPGMAAAAAGPHRRRHGGARGCATRARSEPAAAGDRLDQAQRGPARARRRSIGDAEIVGLGQSTHGAAEELTLKHRALRLLVERLGFRSVAWEEDWTTGLRINEYIQTGKGDLDTLMGQMSPQWQSRQVADVLAWLRDYNADHADKTSHAALVSSGCGRSVGGAV